MIAMFDKKYAFLSNFFPSPFTVAGITYPTVEHWFQAWKCEDEDEALAVASAGSPGEAKKMGRRCRLRSDWEEIKVDIMRMGLKYKFQDPKLRKMLLDTGDEELIEGNFWHDNTWGDCQCAKCQNTPGRNMLGMLLMELRKELMYAEADEMAHL